MPIKLISASNIHPEYLLQKGFVEIDRGWVDAEDKNISAAIYYGDFELEPDSRIFVEPGCDRQFFVVILVEGTFKGTNQSYYPFDIYVQENIGCGFSHIPPNQRTEMPIEDFEALYQGVKHKKLENIKIAE